MDRRWRRWLYCSPTRYSFWNQEEPRSGHYISLCKCYTSIQSEKESKGDYTRITVYVYHPVHVDGTKGDFEWINDSKKRNSSSRFTWHNQTVSVECSSVNNLAPCCKDAFPPVVVVRTRLPVTFTVIIHLKKKRFRFYKKRLFCFTPFRSCRIDGRVVFLKTSSRRNRFWSWRRVHSHRAPCSPRCRW